MKEGIIQKVLTNCYANYLNTGDKTFIGLVNMIEQELITKIEKYRIKYTQFSWSGFADGNNSMIDKLIGDVE